MDHRKSTEFVTGDLEFDPNRVVVGIFYWGSGADSVAWKVSYQDRISRKFFGYAVKSFSPLMGTCHWSLAVRPGKWGFRR